MIPSSWSDNPRLLLERRVKGLLIGETTYFETVRIHRAERCTYYLRCGRWREKVNGIEAVAVVIELAGRMAQEV